MTYRRETLLLALVAMLATACPVQEQQEHVEARRAYIALLESNDFPKDTSAEIRANLAAIREAPEAINELLVEALSFGREVQPTYGKALAILYLLPDTGMKLEIARQAVATHPIGQGAPLLQFLARQGGMEDLPRLQAEIEADPNGKGVGIAIAVQQSEDQEKIERLRVLGSKAPGAWQNYLEPRKPADDRPNQQGVEDGRQSEEERN